jgi:hypothetical protein
LSSRALALAPFLSSQNIANIVHALSLSPYSLAVYAVPGLLQRAAVIIEDFLPVTLAATMRACGNQSPDLF